MQDFLYKPQIDPFLLRTDEAAKFLNVSRNTLYELVRRGEIPFLRVSKSIRFSRDGLIAWVQSRQETTGKPEAQEVHTGKRRGRPFGKRVNRGEAA